MDFQPQINALIQQTSSLECSENNIPPATMESTTMESEFTLIARLHSEKSINMGAFKNTLLKAWNLRKKVNTNQLQQNLMAFIFEDQNDAEKVLNLSWSFRDSQVIVQKWPPDKALHEINLNKTVFWIQAFNIPVCFTTHDSATFIGNTVGTFIKSDLHSSSQKWKKSLRIQVEIDTLKPLIPSVLLPCHGRSSILIEIRYERLSEFCFKCGLLGHKFQTCPMDSGKDNMVASTFPFGPWIKTENTHTPNPGFLKTSLTINQNQTLPQITPTQIQTTGKTTFSDLPQPSGIWAGKTHSENSNQDHVADQNHSDKSPAAKNTAKANLELTNLNKFGDLEPFSSVSESVTLNASLSFALSPKKSKEKESQSCTKTLTGKINWATSENPDTLGLPNNSKPNEPIHIPHGLFSSH